MNRVEVRKVRALPTAAEKRMAANYKRAWNDLAAGMNQAEALAGLSAQDAAMVMASFDWPSFETKLAKVGNETAIAFNTTAAREALGMGIAFDVENPRAIHWAEQNSARLVVETSQLQQAELRNITLRSLHGEMTVKQAATAIRGVVGLHTRFANAVFNYHAGLLSSGMDAEAAALRADRYATRLRNLRADTIARTEIMSAQNAGRVEGWNQAFDAGLVNRSESQKQWLVSDDDRTCQQCLALDGEIVGVDQVFSDGGFEPPAHPDCRCVTMLLTPPRTAQAPAPPPPDPGDHGIRFEATDPALGERLGRRLDFLLSEEEA